MHLPPVRRRHVPLVQQAEGSSHRDHHGRLVRRRRVLPDYAEQPLHPNRICLDRPCCWLPHDGSPHPCQHPHGYAPAAQEEPPCAAVQEAYH